MEKSAVAYRANGIVVIAPVIRTSTGLGLEVEPQALGETPSEEDIVALYRTRSQNRIALLLTQRSTNGTAFFDPFSKRQECEATKLLWSARGASASEKLIVS